MLDYSLCKMSITASAKSTAITGRTLRESFRTRADSITDSRARQSGGRKKFNENLKLNFMQMVLQTLKNTALIYQKRN